MQRLLEAFQVTVTMEGLDYTIDGIIPEMTIRGTLRVHAQKTP
jgi:hypothetical protein